MMNHHRSLTRVNILPQDASGASRGRKLRQRMALMAHEGENLTSGWR